MTQFSWTIRGVNRIPRDQWDALCAASQRVFEHSETLVYGHARTGKPVANESAIRCAPHPTTGSGPINDFILTRGGTGRVICNHPLHAAACFAILQCAHELLKDPTKFDWETDTVPEAGWLGLAQNALSESEGAGDPSKPDENEWDNSNDQYRDAENAASGNPVEVQKSEPDSMDPAATPEQTRESDSPPSDLSDQPDVITIDGPMPMSQLAELIGGSSGSAEQQAQQQKQASQALDEQLHAAQTLADAQLSKIEALAEKKIEEVTRPVRIEVTSEKDPEPVEVEGTFHRCLPEIVEWLQAGINVMLVGPAGSGKTTLASQAAEILKRPFSFTGALVQKYELLGYNDAGGTYHPTTFRKAFAEGHVFLWDELDASNAQATVAFNASLENPWADFPDGVIDRHPDFVAIAAANTYGNGANRQYVGRNALDGATLDRFACIHLDYDPALEMALSGNNEWVASVQLWREACEKLGIKHIISQRASIKGATMLRRGVLSQAQIESALVFKGLDKDTIAKIRNEAGV